MVTHPAHWRPATVDALRGALSAMREFSEVALVSDAKAAVTALRDDPGLPTSGLIALCDFGGSGTSITLVDAANGGEPVGQTVRYTELSGDLIDKAVLTQVLEGLSDAGSVDVTGTSAIGPLSRLRTQCRAAKERLSTTAATSLVAELPGHRGEVRLTRNELDDAIRQPLTDFAGVLQETLDRNGARGLAAVASAGGGARIPLITTTLSEHFGVPVITTAQPELTSAIGGGLTRRSRDRRGGRDRHGRSGELRPPPRPPRHGGHPDGAGSPWRRGGVRPARRGWPGLRPTTFPMSSPRQIRTTTAARRPPTRWAAPRPQMQFEPETDQYQADAQATPVRPARRRLGPGPSRDRGGGVVRAAQ